MAAGISAAVGAVVLEAICDAGVAKVGLSATDFGFELHRAIATTVASKPKKKRTRNLFTCLLFLRQHPHPNAHASGDEYSHYARPGREVVMMTDPDVHMCDKPPHMGQTNQTENECRDAEPHSLRVHASIIAIKGSNCLVNRSFHRPFEGEFRLRHQQSPGCETARRPAPAPR